MAELLTHAVTQYAEKKLESRETLACRVDDLLERYLHLLDQHQRLRQDLNTHLSSGYLSLAHANFSNPNRIRYGQDYYDERMQATTLVSLKISYPSFSIMESGAADCTKAKRDDKLEDGGASRTNASAFEPLSNDKGKRLSMAPDPLDWFGILVPQALRTSQSIFKVAVTDIVPALVSIANEMKDVEIEVRRVRKRLRKAS